MNRVAKRVKKNKEVFEGLAEPGFWDERLSEVITRGKKALDETCAEIGRILAETLMVMDREEMSGWTISPTIKNYKNGDSKEGRCISAIKKSK